MKQCSACRKEKSTSEFARKGKGLQDQCKECKAEYNRRHYRRNKKSYMDRAIAQRREVQAYLENLKRQPCKDCGVSYPPYMMDFDHVRGEKKFNLCSGPRRRGVKQVMEEVAKCEVVCANCHRERTHKRS